MADQIQVVVIDTPASPGDLDITHVGITEPFSAAIFFYAASLTDSADIQHGRIGVGFCSANPDSAVADASSSCQIEDNVTASDNGQTSRNTDCVRVQAGTAVATNVISGSFGQAIPGGVRLSFATTTERTRLIAILFAGLDETCVNLVVSGTTPVAEPCTAEGSGTFEPDLLVWVAVDTAGGSQDESEAQPNIGFAVNGGDQVCSFFNVDETDPTDSDGSARTDTAFGKVAITGRAEQLTTVAFSATGFTHTSNVSGNRGSYLALKFSDATTAACKQLAVSGSTGDQDFTSLGVSPSVVLGMSTLLAATDTLTDGPTASGWGFFVTGPLGSRAYTAHSQDGLNINPAVTSANTRQEDVAVLTYDHLGTVAQRATWVGVIGGGFRLNFSVATAGHLVALAIALPQPAVVISETENITESVVAFLNRSLVVSDTVQIGEDAPLLGTFDVTTSDGPQGTTFEAHPERGTALQGGAEAGTVF